MTGAELKTYLDRRLGIEGVASDQWSPGELYDYLTEARDEVVQAMSLAAPQVVQTLVTLEQVGATVVWKIPDATADPLRCIVLRSVTGHFPLNPAAYHDQDGGDYEWIDTRQVRLAENVSPEGGLEGYFVLHAAEITSSTVEADIGAPTPLHRLIGKYAAVLALTADEDSDATNALGLYQRELDKVERIYSEFDGQGAMAFREAFLMSYGAQYPDSLY